MNAADLAHYFVPAVENLFEDSDVKPDDWDKNHGRGSKGWPAFVRLDKLLGSMEYRNYYKNPYSDTDPPISEDFKILLQALAGPHGKTILKAYRIKRGLE